MKYLIASDLHGSGSCTRQLLERCAAEGADMLVLLGDLLYHGPRNNLPGEYDPKIVSALLNEHKEHIIAVRGNCEAEVDQMMLEFPCMADYTYLWFSSPTAIATTTTACRRWPLRARSCSTATPTFRPTKRFPPIAT